ncbi:MAG: aldose epimerase family protein [Gaiellaceae bacterium]|jgi:aldose 1-epimerase
MTKWAKHRAPSITKEPFGTVDSTAVDRYTLTNSSGMKVMILTYGGIIQEVWVPDKHHHMANVTLGYASLTRSATNSYVGSGNSTYFGALIGRYGNRIALGKFTLNGVTYTLPINNSPNSLHGGTVGFDKHVWDVTKADVGPNGPELGLHLLSPDGDSGYPAALDVNVTYTLTKANQIKIDYSATNQSATLSTVINLTNHTYFNLAGEGSGGVQGQDLMINADSYTPVNANLIPTGVLTPVAGTPFDFRTAKPIGRDINSGDPQLVLAHGFDHNWVLNRSGSGLSLAARAYDPASGRVLTTWTTEPGVQFYSGNFLVGDLVGTSGHTYRQTDGFTLETQHYPDSPNQPSFPSTVLNPGTPFNSTTIYQFSTAGRH